jgi:hypothetical protein
VRTVITARKAPPLLSFSLASSWNRNIDNVQKFAKKVEYPYVLILGEKDVIVDNAAARSWH